MKILILSLLILASIGCERNYNEIDCNNHKILNSVHFGDVKKIKRGFYRGCSFTVEEKRGATFGGDVDDCPNPKMSWKHDVYISASDFLDGLQ